MSNDGSVAPDEDDCAFGATEIVAEQKRIEISRESDGSVSLWQYDDRGEPCSVTIRPENIASVVDALSDARLSGQS